MTHQPIITLILHLNDPPLDASRGDAGVAPTMLAGGTPKRCTLMHAIRSPLLLH